MFKSTVIFTLVVCSFAATASPSAGPTTATPALCDDQVARALAPLHQVIKRLQARGVQSVGRSPTSQTVTRAEFIGSSVSVKLISQLQLTIEKLQQTNEMQVQFIQDIVRSRSLSSPAPPASCVTDDALTNAVSAAVSAAVAPLREHIQLQTQSIQGLVRTTNTPTTTPAPNCTSEDDAVSSLHNIILDMTNTIERQNNTIQELTNKMQMMNTTRLTPTSTPAPTDCGHDSGYEYSEETASCYKYHDEWRRWSQARDACGDEGGHLAIIGGRGEARLLSGMVIEKNGLYAHVHVGYHRDDAGEWRTVTGESVEAVAGYSPWGAGYPVSEEQRRYAVIWKGDGTLVNVVDEFERPFICEKRPQ